MSAPPRLSIEAERTSPCSPFYASRAICAELNQRMGGIEGEMNANGAALDRAMKRSEAFLQVSEELIETVAECGIETEDSPFIQAAQQAAARIASARNRRAFLLQTYRRDMGGGKFVLLKEAAAPIVVDGRHWGGLRLAFQF